MRPSRPRPVVIIRAALPLAAGLSLLLAGAALGPAAASTAVAAAPAEVPLGAHRFGHLRQPDAVVATAGPDEVDFVSPPPGADGLPFGPISFDVARDGSVWLLDGADDQRLLVWQPGQPGRPARSVALPDDPLERIADFAIAPDGTIYASYVPPPGSPLTTLRLAALDPGGKVRWTADTVVESVNSQLRIGPDGTLYFCKPFESHWTPLTTPAGRPLSRAEQRRRATTRQPLAGGRWLTTTHASPYRWDLTFGEGDRAVRGWKVTSQTDVGGLGATPAVVGGDPVVVVRVSKQTSARFLYEYEVLRLAPDGATRQRFAIAPASRVVWGDDPITGVRVGPDGHLYQLRTDNRTGVSIVRYSLGTAASAPPATEPGSGSPQPTRPPATRPAPDPTLAPSGDVPPASISAAPAAGSSSTTRWLLPGLAALAAALLAALGAWRLYRRSHPTGRT